MLWALYYQLRNLNRDEINDEAIFFDGQRRRLRGVIALARCVETVNDTLPASHEKAQTAASLRAVIAELSEAAHGLTSLEQSHRGGSLLFASKSFEAFDKAQARPCSQRERSYYSVTGIFRERWHARKKVSFDTMPSSLHILRLSCNS